MKKIICIAVAAMALLLAGVSTGHASRGGHGGHGRVDVWVGPGWGPWWGPYYPYYPYYYYPYHVAPPVVIREEPGEYVHRNMTPQASEPVYWYFCRDPEGYYPYVKKCPKGWLKVVPPATSPDEEE